MKETLYVRTEHRDFEHGEIESKPVPLINNEEHRINANVHLVVTNGDVSNFKDELEELLKKYAI